MSDAQDSTALIARALERRAEGDYAQAIALLRSVCDGQPHFAGALAELAFTHLKAGEPVEARAFYRRALDVEPGNRPALLGMAQLSQAGGDPAGAAASLRRVVANDIGTLQPLRDLAASLRALGETDQADAILYGLLAANAQDWLTLVELGLRARQAGDHAGASGRFAAAHAANPGHRGIRRELAFSLVESGGVEQAAELYRGLLADDPHDRGAVLGLARCMRRGGDTPGAAQRLAGYLAEMPADVEARLELASCLVSEGSVKAAQAQYVAALGIDPQCWRAHAGLGVLARRGGDPAAALQHFRQGLAVAPDNFGLRGEVAFTLVLLDRLDEAETLYLDLQAAEPGNALALHGRALVARRRNDPVLALDLACSAMERDPANPEHGLLAASLHRELGEYAASWRVACALAARLPDNAEAWLEQGRTARAMGERHAALSAFQRAAALGGTGAGLEEAVELAALGAPEQAADIYRKLLMQDACCAPALAGLAELAMLAGSYEECAACCARAQAADPRLRQGYWLHIRACLALGEVAQARLVVEQAARALDRDEALGLALAVECAAGERGQAMRLLADPAFRSPPAFPAWLTAAQAWLDLGDGMQARAMLDRVPPCHGVQTAQLHLVRARVAELEWRTAAAAQDFGEAVRIAPNLTEAHQGLARACLLTADHERAARHMESAMAQDAAALALRQRHGRVGQTLIGHLRNEMRLQPELAARLAHIARYAAGEQIEPLIRLVREHPGYTPAGMFLLRALAETNAWRACWGDASPPRIEQRVMQCWDDGFPPSVQPPLDGHWQSFCTGGLPMWFDYQSAAAYLLRHLSGEVFSAFRQALTVSQAADVFRLAYLAREGGVHAGPALICQDQMRSGAWRSLAGGAAAVFCLEQTASLSTAFLACVPGHPIVAQALREATAAILNGDTDNIWLSTGPGLLTRLVANAVATGGLEVMRDIKVMLPDEAAMLFRHSSVRRRRAGGEL